MAYARIQDIHLVSNAFERWLGLARVQVLTASGSAKAEMTIEGVESYEELRDFLYSLRRGARPEGVAVGVAEGAESGLSAVAAEELTTTLRQVAAELRGMRLALADRQRKAPDA